MTRLRELLARMGPGLEQRVEHLVADQPFLGQGVSRQVDPVAVADPPAMAFSLPRAIAPAGESTA